MTEAGKGECDAGEATSGASRRESGADNRKIPARINVKSVRLRRHKGPPNYCAAYSHVCRVDN